MKKLVLVIWLTFILLPMLLNITTKQALQPTKTSKTTVQVHSFIAKQHVTLSRVSRVEPTPRVASLVISSSVTLVSVTPTPVSVPIGVDEPASSTLRQTIQSYIIQKFGGYANRALCIVSNEDGSYDPTRVGGPNYNGTYDYGIFQINSVHGYPLSTVFNWQDNVDIAYNMSGGGTNWSAWSTRYDCGL